MARPESGAVHSVERPRDGACKAQRNQAQDGTEEKTKFLRQIMLAQLGQEVGEETVAQALEEVEVVRGLQAL